MESCAELYEYSLCRTMNYKPSFHTSYGNTIMAWRYMFKIMCNDSELTNPVAQSWLTANTMTELSNCVHSAVM